MNHKLIIMSPLSELQSQMDKLNRDMQSIKIQQNCTFQVVETGLADLSRSLDSVLKFNDSQKTIIHHLKAVVESNFNQINKHENFIKQSEVKMSKLDEVVKALSVCLDEKINGLEQLKQTVASLQNSFTSVPVSPFFLPEPASNELETPRSLKGYHFGLMDLDFPATPELFGHNDHYSTIFPPNN
jgi:chromosome segregation ATPase